MDINQEFWKAEYEAEQMCKRYEQEEYLRLKVVCPILQKTTDINEAIAYCILCNQKYCETTDKQETLQ